ncbi:cob(I)yrinic acid a,c-diamide adenosyltransferase [uncultured Polaribacter sp.]|uniref:cob(I)yrinic acid a,c-diamide adenosyltransferase n=1 Tax=uncultured Polaribacter sp. TaxID=174711 RepID=UPI00260C3F0B|nr:cob(I)yrinic acid a,c-diamide adenosyltransferase [uncultured Polaribacter sp.]
MKIYTKTGDSGMTSLYGGTKVSKGHIRIDSYGTIDELNSYLGLIRDQEIDKRSHESLVKIQKELFSIGAVLATPEDKLLLKNRIKRLENCVVTPEMIVFLEAEIDHMDASLPKMTHFILPGGHTTVSYCHIARCVCRRAERLVVLLAEESSVEIELLSYMNRLSDYLFVLARKLTLDLKAEEIKWVP